MFKGMEAKGPFNREDAYREEPATITVPTDEYACTNCHRNEKVDKLPARLCYSTWHLKENSFPISERLTMQVYIYHTDCPNAEGWRRDNKISGFPKFYALVHERYAPQNVTLKCEGCGTHVKHGFVHATEIEDL